MNFLTRLEEGSITAAAASDIAEHDDPSRRSDPEKLRAYTKTKLAVATQLRGLLEILKKRGSEARFRRSEELMAKLAEDRFTLAVVGQFKRGKSSLMNAIIGRELLPTGVLPLTSAITILKFGTTERVVVHREGLQFPEVVPVSALASYVTENGNPGNRKKVKTAALEVPLPFLRRGLEFVDTPGVGSAIQANTATTYAFLPECDAVLFVTSVDTPFTEVELDFLGAIREHVRKIFFVVNKTDLLSDRRERDEVFKFIESEIRAEMETSRVRIFPVSSRLALTKTASPDGDSFADSGLKELQEALATFLSYERGTVFLSAIIDKALRLVDEESGELELYKRTRSLPEAAVQERFGALRMRWRELAAARQKMFEQLREDLSQRAIESNAPQLDELLQAEQKELARHLKRIIAGCGWRFGEEVTNHWTKFVARRLIQTTASWSAEVAARAKLESQPETIETSKRIAANLCEIPKLAAVAFDLPLPETESVLPRFRPSTFHHEDLALKKHKTSLSAGLSILPARLTARWLQPALAEETNRLLKIHRAHALAIVGSATKSTANKWSAEVNEAASEIESRVISAITGEQSASTTWRQTSSPLAGANWGGAELTSIRAKLIEIRERASFDRTSAEKQVREEELPAAEPPAAQTVSRPFQTAQIKETDLASDLRTRGCAVCDYVVKTAHDFFAQWQYAIASDEKAQSSFAAEQGFCSLHTWQLHALSSPVGESIGLARLTEHISRLLAKVDRGPAAASNVHTILHTSGNCRVCHMLNEAEAAYLARLGAFLADARGRQIYERSQGICLRHLARLLAITSGEIRGFLLATASRRLEETAEDMQSFAIKRDALRRNLTNANEDDAYMRALIHLAGAKDYSTPWPEDREI
jgi:predicted GTPase